MRGDGEEAAETVAGEENAPAEQRGDHESEYQDSKEDVGSEEDVPESAEEEDEEVEEEEMDVYLSDVSSTYTDDIFSHWYTTADQFFCSAPLGAKSFLGRGIRQRRSGSAEDLDRPAHADGRETASTKLDVQAAEDRAEHSHANIWDSKQDTAALRKLTERYIDVHE